MKKIGRNTPCICGSGKKYKKCHGTITQENGSLGYNSVIAQHNVQTRIRENQQGKGKPIISASVRDHTMVAVGNKLHWSTEWKTFPDFLLDYLKKQFGAEWAARELEKPVQKRHPLFAWLDHLGEERKNALREPGEMYSLPINGASACILGLAYNLYLLDHNSELQTRLLKRLRDTGNFQGAYYELMVAGVLIRAGFILELEDEADRKTKHCEFSAISPETSKKYWIEAKMRGVSGTNPLSSLVQHLNQALAKPANDERLIFVDLNTDSVRRADGTFEWVEPAAAKLGKFETAHLPKNGKAYVFVTNMAFHRHLDTFPAFGAFPYGLGMPDFNRPGMMRLRDAYKNRQSHIDAYRIGDAISKYTVFPQTLDGSLPSVAFDESEQILVGQTYLFDNADGSQFAGEVTAACVSEPEKKMYIAVTHPQENNSQIFTRQMTDSELSDFRANREAYFGRLEAVMEEPRGRYELFEWLMQAHHHMTRENLLDQLVHHPEFDTFQEASDEHLLATYCEALVAMVPDKPA